MMLNEKKIKKIFWILCLFLFSAASAQNPVRQQNGSSSAVQNRINPQGSSANIPTAQNNPSVQSAEPQIYYSESLRPKTEKNETTEKNIKNESEFQLIGIKPYFKNKDKIAKLKMTLISFDHSLTSELEQSLGDCSSCVRGASVKGKIGLRIYGDKIENLMIKHKALSSVQVKRCTEGEKFINQIYECEFDYQNKQYKLTLQVFAP